MSEPGTNPWLTAADGASDVEAPPLTGPSQPQASVNAPADGLTTKPSPPDAGLWVMGAHGGAGATSLCAFLPYSHDAGQAWPAPDERGHAKPVVVVARSSAYGLACARTVLQQWASGGAPGVELLGMVVVADAPGKLPSPLRSLVAHAGGGAPRVWRVPWVEAWRFTEAPDPETAPRRVRKVSESIRAAQESVSSLSEGEKQ